MVVFDLYSKRRKRELGETTDVFTYDDIPRDLRTQIIHVWNDAIGEPALSEYYEDEIQEAYQEIVKILRREYSVFQLSSRSINPNDPRYAKGDLCDWFLAVKDSGRVLDAVELSFRFIERICSKYNYAGRGDRAEEAAKEAIKELNIRFKEHGIGYQYSDGQIVRVDSLLIHKEVVVPALTVLRGKEYENAQLEFLSAYEHFRHGKKQEALVDCYKCFESTMKVICTKRKWPFDPKAAAKGLVNVCLTNGLIPAYWQGHFGGLRSVLESAISTPRNRQAGHGAGASVAPEVPEELVSYVLHMTAATVLFLAEAEKKLP
ncbi:STM4504/CBY_0614 family protein [Bradyrhizobium sp. DASA03076]|uniref:STM4504/CBY_0614 family protein n=1 Tax=Bradyrhizobium sp. BLXBL-03 TaxID=3395916 RepID=UPI003F6FF49B